ncbi:restriction endonuclease subunit S [Thiothrix nivea]|uniref:Restriction modification system DNA specificity domain-containing protein n=1 Tax=Thiothrix nivea (strain ATCC 35100 / DSM 5205 / JP2) TaxID=870187 RepID=A0A656HH42_THINJ|nr:restriction endonuclease subunit S [Thiothrix nivea]EIJ34519.1 restriction modification system DNA specificity domain-containing protein [Thiothrix nivea DSM 5205]
MSPFDLSPEVSDLKVFFTNFSDLDGRLDPLYYFSVNNLDIVNATVYPVKKLSDVIAMTRGRFGHRPRNDPRFYGGEYPFIQTGDIVRASQSNGKITYSQTLNELGLKTSRLFDKPVVVITIAANIGDTAILDYPACFPDSLIGMQPKNNELMLEYISLYFKFIKSYLNDLAPQSAQKNINYQQLSPIPIVIPPLSVQKKAVDLYESALINKAEKEQKAKSLLAGIDAYLLGELGVTLPKQDNSIGKRVFFVPSSEVFGGRFDPKLYDSCTKGLKSALYQSAFEKRSLRTLLIQSISGDWGKDIDDEICDGFQKCLVIRSTEFDNQYNLNLDGSRTKYRLIADEKLRKIDIQVNDLLIEKSGGSPDQPVGRVAIITNDNLSKTLCYSNFIHKIRVDNSLINSEYLFNYLKVMHQIRLTDAMQSQTNGIRNLIMSSFLSQQIVMPPMIKQIRIAQHIQTIRNQAAELQREAAQTLADAKVQVERMILGE